ncbi:GNAT family N-acetyltransferase [Terriglobus saanensis]|uniref:GCN5-related N-acetyltransferase n=1 Tax=Terriglobus saanensis (strain ATCC BAA-1853 / DSM 23119 / SP1PR4) TaxID=401053 RepID=E8V6W4_TERSS|nr:GNAT family N-acetyltransferase [Terriglobus saanensis]ADV83916.1 GCN5-related N-acetyltransferase [Terriglobus saanensis SP1PR4]
MSTEEFQIRRAEPRDIPELRELIELSVRHLQKNDYSAAQIEGALGHALGLDTQLVEDGTYFVAAPIAEPDRIVASGGWSYRRTLFGSDHGPNRELTLLDPATEPAKIRAIFVHHGWSRRGLGTLMLKHCEDAAHEAGFRKLEMGSTLTGVPLYSLKGYLPREYRTIPLPNGETLPIVHMTKTL